MKNKILIIILIIAAFLAGALLTPKYNQPPQVITTPSKSKLDSNLIFDQINGFRQSNDLEPLKESEEICKLAKERAQYIQEKNTPAVYENKPEIAHNGLEEFQKRYSGKFMLEIWQNSKELTNEAVTLRWLNSKDHRVAIENYGGTADWKEGCAATYQDVTDFLLGQPN